MNRQAATAMNLCLISFLAHVVLSAVVLATDTATPAERFAARTFPSAFQAWNPADNLKGEDPWTTLARHDLVFHDPRFFGLRWAGEFVGLSTKFVDGSRPAALDIRRKLLGKNPNLIMLAELHYRDADASFLPENHQWWKRKDGKRVRGWAEGGYFELDFSNPSYQAQIARQAKTVMDCGVFDGVMLDWWQDDDARLALVQAVRKEIGDKALILVNANDRKTPRTASFVNGYFMECYKSKTADDWRQIADTLAWAESNLKEPRINCLETWFHKSRNDLPLMRATTTLSLTMSNGYCLFSDPNSLPTPDHLHNWYDFWNKSLGRPKAKGVHHDDGSYWREFENGVVVYNPLGNKPATIHFMTPHRSVATKERAMTFTVPPEDGDLFLNGEGGQ